MRGISLGGCSVVFGDAVFSAGMRLGNKKFMKLDSTAIIIENYV